MQTPTGAKIPGRVLVFTLRRLNVFFRGIVERNFEGPHAFCSFWPGLESINLQHEFYKHFRSRAISNVFSEEDYRQIITRCRVLRSLPREKSRRMIDAMYRVIDHLTDAARPDYFLSTMVDSYISDLFARICRKKDIEVIMIASGVTSDTILVTAYGEYNNVRNVPREEIDRTLESFLDDGSMVTYALKQQKYSFRRHLKTWGTWWAKCGYFRAAGLLTRDPLNYRYLAGTLPDIDGQRALESYRCYQFPDVDWEQTMARDDGRPPLFIPLSHMPEASTEYWLKDMRYIDYENFIVDSAHSLSSTYRIVVKEHWSVQGMRRPEFYRRLKDVPGLVLVPAEANSRAVMQRVERVLVGAGTTGVEAAIRGKKVATLGPPYYYMDDSYLNLGNADRVKQLPQLFDSFQPPENTSEQRRRLIGRMLESTLQGSLCPLNRVAEEENVAITGNSLKNYVLSCHRAAA